MKEERSIIQLSMKHSRPVSQKQIFMLQKHIQSPIVLDLCEAYFIPHTHKEHSTQIEKQSTMALLNHVARFADAYVLNLIYKKSNRNCFLSVPRKTKDA